MTSPTIETILVNPFEITQIAVSSVINVTFTSAITETNINNMLTLRDRNLVEIPNEDISFSIFTKTSDNSGKYWIGNVFVNKTDLYYPEAEIFGSYNNVYLVAKLYVDTVTTFTYTNKLVGPRNETMLAYYKPCYDIKRINKQIVNVFDTDMEHTKCSIFGINEKTYEMNPNPNVVIPFGYNLNYKLYNKQGVPIVTNGVGNINEGFGSVVADIYTFKFSVGFINYTIAYNKHNDLLLNIIQNVVTQWVFLINKPDISKFATESDYYNYSLFISFKILDLDDSNDNVISNISTNYGTEFGSIFPKTSEIIIKKLYLTNKENDNGKITSSNNINSITNYIKRSIGNVLGIGHYWYLSTSPLSYDGLNNKYYSGTNGFNQYKIMMSSLLNYNGRLFGMPIEDNNENSIFIEEGKEGNLSSKVTLNGLTHPGLDKDIMTNWVDSVYYVDGLLTSLPISNVTLGLLEDIGYDVCYNNVDIYSLPTITNIDYEIYITYDSSVNIFERLTDTYIQQKNKYFIKMPPNLLQSDINKLFSDYVNTVVNNSVSFPINEIIITLNSSIEATFLNIDGNSIEIFNNIDTDVETNTTVYKLTTIRQSDGFITALLDKHFYKYDVIPPIIVLNGDSIINHEINTTYIDYGATASDNLDGDITNNIIVGNNINTTVFGSYNVTYDIVDYNNNVAIQKIRIVNVIDTINPVVVLVNLAEITLNNGESYIEYGANASDNSLEVLTVSISGTVITTVPADYTVTYTATDSTGNVHSIGRLIHVIDTINPVVVLNGLTEVTYSINEYFEEGATASDNSNEVLTVSISTFDDSVDGDYNVTYTATDSTGNTHTIGRLVHIEAPLGVLVYSNSTTNIFDHVKFASLSGVENKTTTVTNWTATNPPVAYAFGDYQFITSTFIASCWRAFTTSGVLQITNPDKVGILTSHIYGDINYAVGKAYDTNGIYTGRNFTVNTNGVATGSAFVKFDTYCNNNATTYSGEFLQWTFPFYVEASVLTMTSNYLTPESVLLGSNDGGNTWDFISDIFIDNTIVSPYDIPISATKRYSTFRWIAITSIVSYGSVWVTQLKLFGDIYK